MRSNAFPIRMLEMGSRHQKIENCDSRVTYRPLGGHGKGLGDHSSLI